MMVSFVLSFFPRDVLDEILNLIESVSEDFPSYSFKQPVSKLASILGTSHFNHFKVSAGRSEAKRNLACEILSDSQAAWGFWCWDVRQRHTNTQ